MTARSRSRSKPRGLSDDDRAVWQAVAKLIRRKDEAPPHSETQDTHLRSAEASRPVSAGDARNILVASDLPRPVDAGVRTLRPKGQGGAPVNIRAGDTDPQPVGRPEAGIDRRTAQRLRQGQRRPDARLDLHGMTADRAHRALDRFIADALARGLRCVLVITGKGGRLSHADDRGFMRSDRGVLRQDAPRWLRSGPHAREIIGIYEAHRRHGGEGALYIYLKKRR